MRTCDGSWLAVSEGGEETSGSGRGVGGSGDLNFSPAPGRPRPQAPGGLRAGAFRQTYVTAKMTKNLRSVALFVTASCGLAHPPTLAASPTNAPAKRRRRDTRSRGGITPRRATTAGPATSRAAPGQELPTRVHRTLLFCSLDWGPSALPQPAPTHRSLTQCCIAHPREAPSPSVRRLAVPLQPLAASTPASLTSFSQRGA